MYILLVVVVCGCIPFSAIPHCCWCCVVFDWTLPPIPHCCVVLPFYTTFNAMAYMPHTFSHLLPAVHFFYLTHGPFAVTRSFFPLLSFLVFSVLCFTINTAFLSSVGFYMLLFCEHCTILFLCGYPIFSAGVQCFSIPCAMH